MKTISFPAVTHIGKMDNNLHAKAVVFPSPSTR